MADLRRSPRLANKTQPAYDFVTEKSSSKGAQKKVQDAEVQAPSYMAITPILWPFAHLAKAFVGSAGPYKNSASPWLDISGHLSSFLGSLRSWVMAYACVFYLAPLIQPSGMYPAFGAAKNFEFSWTFPIIVRNLLATWVICGSWDYLLYFSPLKDRLAKFKFNPKYPTTEQITHDAIWTTSATMTGSALEIVCCYCWCNGIFPKFAPLEVNAFNVLWILFITHWRIPHFYLIHRAMHPWKPSVAWMPDFGRFLYRQVHALHHKSYNPTAFSGTNMHPVESTLYYSASLICVPFGCHPTIVLGCIVDCAVGAWLGHDGFQWPGSGDYFHQLHHQHFDCNYGATHVPLDWVFGTYIGHKDELKKVWGRKAAGADANDTPVHKEN